MLTVSRLAIARRCVPSASVFVARRGVATAFETKQQREERIKKEQERQNAVALERMARSEMPMDFDIKMQQLSILDLRYPFPIATAPPGIKGKFTWFLDALRDRFMSITSFRKAYRVGLLPKPSLRQLFTLSSKPFAERALSAYESMNSEFARGDARALARVCSEEQLDRLRQRIKSRPRDQRIEWSKAGGGKVKVVSFRTVDAWSSKKPEDHLAQALVRFDTRQSLAVYSHSGKLLSGDPKKVVPVQEYMIMERKNWSEGDWMLRKSIPPNPPTNLANA